MKKEIFERYCLLDQSGELSRWGKWRLERYLASSESAQKQKAGLQHILDAASQESSIEPSTFVKEQIMREARRHSPSAREHRLRGPGWLFQPAVSIPLAIAALLMIAVFSIHQLRRPSTLSTTSTSVTADELLAWDSEFDEEVNEMLATVYAAEIERFPVGSDTSLWPEDDLPTEKLAEELLTWENQS